MPIPGHRQSPPKSGKKKSRSNNRYYGSFPVHHIPFWQKGNDKQSPENSEYFQAEFSAKQKTLSYVKHVRKKHQSRSSDLHSQAK